MTRIKIKIKLQADSAIVDSFDFLSRDGHGDIEISRWKVIEIVHLVTVDHREAKEHVGIHSAPHRRQLRILEGIEAGHDCSLEILRLGYVLLSQIEPKVAHWHLLGLFHVTSLIKIGDLPHRHFFHLVHGQRIANGGSETHIPLDLLHGHSKSVPFLLAQ